MGPVAATALLVAVAYYGGANLGFMLRLPPATPSVLWAPNTILTAALLLSPPRRWWVYLLAALPAHLLVESSLPWPLWLVLALFLTNCSQALIAAAGVRLFSDAPTRFDTLRRVTVFIVAAGLAAPFFSSFPDAAAVTAGLGEPYWLVWRTRFCSNVLTELLLGPVIVMTVTAGPAWVREASRVRKAEAALLAVALALVGVWVFSLTESPGVDPGVSTVAFLLPLILLTTVRFGPAGAALALLTTSVIGIWAGAHGRGPFADMRLGEAVLELQVFMTVMAIPMLCLAAVMVERRQATRALAERLRLEILLSGLSATFVRLPSHQMDPAFETSVRQVGEASGVDCAVLCRQFGTDGPIARYTWSVLGSEWGPVVRVEEDFPWTMEQLRRDQAVVFSRPEDLPVAAGHDVESFRRRGIRSAGIVPLLGSADIRGFLALFTVARQFAWGDGLLQWLQLVAGVFTSALARKEAEDALRASELSNSAILGSLSSSVAVLDGDGRIADVNASWARTAAEPQSPAPARLGVGANLLQAWQQAASNGMPAAPEAAAGIQEVLGGGRSGFVLEYSSRGGAGERWFAMSVVPLDGAQAGAVVSCNEITERKRAELEAQRSRQELAHFARVSTMGQLTASIAHELNQPLTGILVNARAGLRFLDADPPDARELRDILRDIVDDDKRAGQVIQRLREILRKGEPQRGLLDFNVLVADVVALLHSDAIIRNVTVTLDLDAKPVLAYGDRVELQQVVLNLLINAMEAMTEVADGDRSIVVTTETTLEAAHVAVRDRGTGIREGSHDRLFDPFFTTKPSGMGMGLAIARSIIEGHGGLIWATDNPGGGAVFHFGLPAAATASV